ncbi:class E sortase [Rathayibacter sp. VKM Ac-2856]|uniref:class E sortase n=1 Tax=unclassified Rathayibacter TaxID=2609250 RepID=UPI000CE889D5|nr:MULTISPECIES: class E sortase [unclassified Rathayibacter]NQX06918.1 class E sortase [Rathayibacter sp. VKM Ac-2858]NQX22117.1 class E sortase [Rathayibacter sp. VKM Ac-2856]PPF18297.1 class E sortase [Rathayibacter sp. AY1A7]PPG36488.1 class E sortase [Rathayibacter sp. AY2B5]PPG47114.1 class E sortase [Rathayibacter sp. AY2B3]
MTASSSVDVSRRRRRPARRRLSFFGVLGELLMTAGVLVLLFLAWQLWWNDAVIAGRQEDQAAELRQSWGDDAPSAEAPSEPTAEPAVPGDPVIAPVAALDTTFGNLYIPRYGEGWVRTIAEGVDAENVLDVGSIGHYPGTQMPGEMGNFAIAAHRSAAGGGMHLIDELQLGDAIYIETADGWYTYRFRNLEYVQPSEVQVIDPVPWTSDVVPTDRLITMTSCNPLLSTAERIIAYGVFESWQPRSAGAPAELASSLAT